MPIAIYFGMPLLHGKGQKNDAAVVMARLFKLPLFEQYAAHKNS